MALEDVAFGETMVPDAGVDFDETVLPHMNAGADLDPGLFGLDLTATQLDRTLMPDGGRTEGAGAARRTRQSLRTTVLPKVRFEGTTPQLKHIDSTRYEVLKELGEGALGEVVLAKDNDIQRMVAMKKLKPDRHQPATVHRFVEEIQMVGALDHPNIVPVHDVGVNEEGQFYFIMKYVKGQTLEDVIERLREGDPEAVATYTPEVRAHIFLDVLRAMRCAHQDHIIHRDLKPANIMIGTYGEAMVMDWGLAKRLKSEVPEVVEHEAIPEQPETALKATGRFATQDGTLIGTPAYMSPEQACGEHAKVDERSDIYALAVLFHELLTTRHYLEDKTSLNALLMGITNKEAEPFSVLSDGNRSKMPAEMLWLAYKGMQKEPEQRFQSVAEMEATLKAILSGQVRVQCPATFMRKTGYDWMHFINNHVIASIALAVTVLCLSIMGLVLGVMAIT